MQRTTVGVVLISVLASLGCNSAADDQLEAAQDAFVRAPTAGTRLRPGEREASAEVVISPGDLAKHRETYLRRLQTKLVDLDLDIAKLASQARMERPEGRRHSERVLADIRIKRERLDTSVRALGPMAEEGWDGSRVAVDREWIELSELVSRAFVNVDLRVRSN